MLKGSSARRLVVRSSGGVVSQRSNYAAEEIANISSESRLKVELVRDT